MARFRKITVQMWLGGSFSRLSPIQPSGQALWLYLLTNPDTVSIPGLYRCGEAQMAEALGWPMKAFREAFREVSGEGMAKADWKARVVWIPKAIKHDPPQSPNAVRAWKKWADEIPECPLKVEAHKGLRAFLEGMGEAFGKAFQEVWPEPSPQPSPNQDSGLRMQDAGEELLSTRAPAPAPAPDPDTPDPYWLAHAWNDTCGAAGMQRVRLPLSKARERKIAGALRLMEAGKDEIRSALLACSRDRHWQGANDRGWRGKLESFLRVDHRERWLDAGTNGADNDPRGAPPVVEGEPFASWADFYAQQVEATGMTIEQIKEGLGHE